jgi:hypothetical protein
MVPVYEPAPIVPGVTVTVSAAVPVVSVVPLAGETESQLLPLVTCAEKPKADPPPDTFTVPGVGFVPPAWYENDSVVGVALTAGAGVTVRLTGAVTTVPPVGVMVMVPLYCPAARLLGFTTLTVRVAGVLIEMPLVTPGESQMALLATVNMTTGTAVLDTCKV